MRRIISFAVIAIFLVGLASAIIGYKHYQAQRTERLARLEQQAANVRVTLLEGWTVKNMAQALEKQGLGSASQFLTAEQKFSVDKYPAVTKPVRADLEGYLFPDTYFFTKDATPQQIIGKMLDNFTSKIKHLGIDPEAKRIPISGYDKLKLSGQIQSDLSLFQILTLASLIEKEGGGTTTNLSLDDERKMISGVFYNRLTIGQPLQSDATVNYATGKDSPSVSATDQQINSPYNTYKYPGLPPGPICNPSLSSIEAALHPIKSDYFYFLHKQPSGEVFFSKTLAEHNKQKNQ